jgi:hypothetical protein
MNAVHRGFTAPSTFPPLGGLVAKIGLDIEADHLADRVAPIVEEDHRRRARRAEAARAPEPQPLASPEPVAAPPAPSAKPGEPLVGADGSVTLAGDDYKLLQRAADIAVRNQERSGYLPGQSFRSRS